MRPPRVAVIPTHNRPAELRRLVDALAPQCDVIIVIDNASSPPVAEIDFTGWVRMPDVIRFDPEQPPNLYRLWNVGLEMAETVMSGSHVKVWDVGVFNDDTDVPPGWWDAVSGPLRAHPAAVVACTGAYDPVQRPQLRDAPDRDLSGRMTPWAWIAKGEIGQRADERFRWWWGDTDWDWRARMLGGVLTVPGPVARNTLANSSTVGALAEQAGRDRQTFIELHGSAPW